VKNKSIKNNLIFLIPILIILFFLIFYFHKNNSERISKKTVIVIENNHGLLLVCDKYDYNELYFISIIDASLFSNEKKLLIKESDITPKNIIQIYFEGPIQETYPATILNCTKVITANENIENETFESILNNY